MQNVLGMCKGTLNHWGRKDSILALLAEPRSPEIMNTGYAYAFGALLSQQNYQVALVCRLGKVDL